MSGVTFQCTTVSLVGNFKPLNDFLFGLESFFPLFVLIQEFKGGRPGGGGLGKGFPIKVKRKETT